MRDDERGASGSRPFQRADDGVLGGGIETACGFVGTGCSTLKSCQPTRASFNCRDASVDRYLTDLIV